MKRRLFIAAASLVLASLPFGAAAQDDSLTAIRRFSKVTDQVWTGGQPTIDQLSTLTREGVRTVISLRVPTESNGEGAREAARWAELGVPFFNIPVDYQSPKPADADAFLAITDAQLANGPVFIHCTAAIRVGAFWMIRRVLRDGWPLDRALEEAHRIGLGNQQHLLDFATEYIDAHKAP